MGREEGGAGGLVYDHRGGSAVEPRFARVLLASFGSGKAREGSPGGVHA